ncbi:MAG: tetratricopeptide repeat protein [Candidatus Zixiibacteriota bacterium]
MYSHNDQNKETFPDEMESDDGLHWNHLSGKNDNGLSSTFLFSAQKLKNKGCFEKALEFYKAALIIDSGNGRIYRGLAHLYYDSLGAIGYSEIENIIIEMACPEDMIFYFWGNINFRRGAIDEAISNFRRSISLNRDNAYSYNNLGVVYLNQGNVLFALSLIKKASKLFRDQRDTKGFALTMGNLGLCKRCEGESHTSYNYFKYTVDITDEDYLLPERLNAICNLAELDLFEDRLIEAEFEFKSATELALNGNSIQQLIRSYLGNGEVQLKWNNYEKGLEYILIAQGLAIVNIDKFWIAESIRKLSRYYVAVNLINKAKECMRKALEIYTDCQVDISQFITDMLDNEYNYQHLLSKNQIGGNSININLEQGTEYILNSLQLLKKHNIGNDSTTYVGADNA